MSFDAIDRQFRPKQMPELECLGCRVTDGVSMENSRTQYHWKGDWNDPNNPNRPIPLCRRCAEEHHAHWDARLPGERRRAKSSQLRILMDSDQQALQPAVVPHPGAVVADYLEYHGWTQRDLAQRTGLTPQTISEICDGKAAITEPKALALEKALRRPAHFWRNLQRQFDEARRNPNDR